MKRLVFLLVCFLGMALLTQGCWEKQIMPVNATASSYEVNPATCPVSAAYDGILTAYWSPILEDATSDDGSYIELEFDKIYAFGQIILHVNTQNDIDHVSRAASFTIFNADGLELATGSYTATESIKEVSFIALRTDKLRITFDQVQADAIPVINEVETYERKFLGIF